MVQNVHKSRLTEATRPARENNVNAATLSGSFVDLGINWKDKPAFAATFNEVVPAGLKYQLGKPDFYEKDEGWGSFSCAMLALTSGSKDWRCSSAKIDGFCCPNVPGLSRRRSSWKESETSKHLWVVKNEAGGRYDFSFNSRGVARLCLR